LSRSWELFVGDMVEAARRVIRYTAGRDRDRFLADEMAYDATLRNMEVLGEAAKKIPETVCRRHPEVDWRGIAGLRDVVAHVYFALDEDTLWRIVQSDIPQLLEHLERIERELP